MKRLVLVAFAALVTSVFADVGKSTPKGFSDDFDASVKAAEKSGKNLWVLFTGSDWCYWCKKLEQEAISKPEFATEGAKHFELVFLNFPNDKSLVRQELVKRNRELADKFGIRGYPTIMLVSPKGEKLMPADRPKAGDDFVKYFQKELEKVKLAPDTAKFITPYEKEFEALQNEWHAKVSDAFQGADRPDVKKYNATLNGLKKVAPDYRAKGDEILKRFRAERVPGALEGEKGKLSEAISRFIKELDLLVEGKFDRKEKDKK